MTNYHVMTEYGEDVICENHFLEVLKYQDFVMCKTDWCNRCYVCEGHVAGTAQNSARQ